MAIDPEDIIRQLVKKGELNAKDLRKLGYAIRKGEPKPGDLTAQIGKTKKK